MKAHSHHHIHISTNTDGSHVLNQPIQGKHSGELCRLSDPVLWAGSETVGSGNAGRRLGWRTCRKLEVFCLLSSPSDKSNGLSQSQQDKRPCQPGVPVILEGSLQTPGSSRKGSTFTTSSKILLYFVRYLWLPLGDCAVLRPTHGKGAY